MKQIIDTLSKAAGLYGELSGRPMPESFYQQLESWRTGIFRIVVMGEIKKGKSSFINALLGEKDLVPVSSNVATSTIFQIHYGERKSYRVHFYAESGKAPLEIAPDEISRYGTEDGNPRNVEKVDFIEVCCPADLLKDGLLIVDTPGLGGLFKEHKRITWQYVPHADAVFFVTDSVESPIGRLELEYLDAVRRITPNHYFVQTKCCAVDSEARETRRTNNLGILASHLGTGAESIPYFLVDSQLRFEADAYQDEEDMAESGYPRLLSFIGQDLMQGKKRILAKRAVFFSQAVLQGLQLEVAESCKLLDAASSEEIDRMDKEISQVRKDLERLQETMDRTLPAEVKKGLDGIRAKAMEVCAPAAPGKDIYMGLKSLIEKAVDNGKFDEAVRGMDESLIESVGIIRRKLNDVFSKSASALVSGLAGSLGCPDLENTGIALQNTLVAKPSEGEKKRMKEEFAKLKAPKRWSVVAFGEFLLKGVFLGIMTALFDRATDKHIEKASRDALRGRLYPGELLYPDRFSETPEYDALVKELCSSCGKPDIVKGGKHALEVLNKTIAAQYARLQEDIETALKGIEDQITSAFKQHLSRSRSELDRRERDLISRKGMQAGQLAAKRNETAALKAQVDSFFQTLEPWMEP